MKMTIQERFEKFKQVHEKPKRYLSDGELEDLMQQVGLTTILDSLGVEYDRNDKDGVYCGFCPDHFIRTGRIPDKPKWYINSKTGKSFCHTEGHTSNIVEIVQNLTGLSSQQEALDKILGGQKLRRTTALERRYKEAQQVQPRAKRKKLTKAEELEKSILTFRKIKSKNITSQSFYDYFAKDGINKETVDKFGIVFCDSGYYRNRALVPFFSSKDEMCGFIAIDILGYEKWCELNRNYYLKIFGSVDELEFEKKLKKAYRKTLYCDGFSSSEHLFGYYEGDGFDDNSEFVLLVEGERDCLKMVQEGIPCLSIHGTHLGDAKAISLKRLNKPIILGFDMDEAGFEARIKAGTSLYNSPFEMRDLYYVDFPNGKDPKKFNRIEMLNILDTKKIIDKSFIQSNKK